MKHTDDVALPVLDYAYVHESTQSTTGYFSCVPPESLDFDAALERLEAAPMDEFLHLHLLRVLASQGQELACRLTEKCYDKEHDLFTRPAMAALLLENALLAEDGVSIAKAAERAGLPVDAASRLATYSPTIHLRACLSPNHVLSAGWSALFRENICGHHAFPVPEDIDMPPLFDRSALEEATHFLRAQTGVMARCHAVMSADAGPAIPRQPAQHTFLRALDALMENGFLDGPEMRHEASLSPIALLRDWKVDVQVDNGRLRHTLRGKATAYGRGLSLAAARASYAMEIVERASAYVSVGHGESHASGVLDRKHSLPLRRARRSELLTNGHMVLDPNLLPLEAPYNDEILHWLPAADPAGEVVFVPAQAVCLFCNLDEPSLFLAGGSTGLASGNTIDEAAVSALTEIVERDAEATTPFARTQCFTLASRDRRIQSLLDDYAHCGIRVQFQDLTSEVGVPVYKCFVMGQGGRVARATAASLSGPSAALAALTETPWPYSTAQSTPPQPSAQGLAGLPVRMLEDLPDYGFPSASANRRLLETVLEAQGRKPVYVDLTRRDLDIPVIRAIIPGLALTSEWDRFSRPDVRLFARYEALFHG